MKYFFRFTALVLCTVLLAGCAAASTAVSQVTSIQPDYPQMAPYPDESQFLDPVSGEFDDATDIIGLKQNPTNGRRFSPIFSFIGHFRYKTRKCYF